ncbi:hypothetical protein SLEP1_g17547 [Rubroshorea leprosula]|uniref:Uncharacterized protein n=1 Tax=Rubroshorea leprosula TaxID=152421 RepID=A0AAV5J3N8_9ROSI|nr:hypothetical protein SLEP1_g17547 [Rubroshorea leprosula]
MISGQILKLYLQILVASDCGMISSEPYAFVGSSHKCVPSATSSDLDSGA